jgi:hypothetical protein
LTKPVTGFIIVIFKLVTGLDMSKPTGGRGNKAPYETRVLRVPVPILDSVNALIEHYRNSALQDDSSSLNCDDILAVLDSYIQSHNLGEKIENHSRYRDITHLYRFRLWLQRGGKE